MGNIVQLEDLLIAYRKAKVDAFHETGHMTALKFAEYEENLIDNLKQLMGCINHMDLKWFENENFTGTFHIVLKKIDFEKLKNNNEKDEKSSSIFYSSSILNWNDIKISDIDFRIIGNHSVDFHVLSSLWIEKVGIFLEDYISNNSYGCRLKNIIKNTGVNSNFDHTSNKIKYSKSKIGHFRSYINDYKMWQYNGIEQIKKSISDGKKVLAVTADLRKFYHRIDCRFIVTPIFKKYINHNDFSDQQDKLNKLLIHAISSWSKNIYINPEIPSEFKFNGHAGIPIGLGASKVIANLLLIHLDRQIENEIKPIYYGRYVDDIFLVLEDGNTIKNSRMFWNYLKKRISLTPAHYINKKSNATEIISEYRPEGFILKIPYSNNSLLEFGKDKEKYFFLEGVSGESFLKTLKDSLDENSSEWNLPPNTIDDLESFSEEMTFASNDLKGTTYGLRMSDGVSIRKLKFILYLTRFEQSVMLLPKEKWDKAIDKFFNLIIEYSFTPENIAIYAKYYPRILSLTIKINRIDLAEKVLLQIFYSHKMLISLKNNINYYYNKNDIIFCINDYIKYQNGLLLESIYSSYNLFSAIEINDIKFKILIGMLTNYNTDIPSYAKRLLNADLHQKPFKELFLYPNKETAIYVTEHRIEFFEQISLGFLDLPNYVDFTSCANNLFENVFGKSLSEPILPYALYFYTRPFTLLELCLLFPYWNMFVEKFKGFCKLFMIEWFEPNLEIPEELMDIHSITSISINAPYTTLNRVVALTSLETKNESWTAVVREDGYEPDTERDQRILDLSATIIKCKRKNIEYVFFPELSIPRRLLIYLSNLFLKKNISVIAGIDYKLQNIPDNQLINNVTGFVSNQLMYMLCVRGKLSTQHVLIIQEKSVPAQSEELELYKIGGKYLKATNDTKFLINHGGLLLTGLICNDLLDINNRAVIRGLIDALIIIEWNRDIDTYDALVEATANDLHTFILQINNRLYGDTRLRGPYKESYERDKVRVRGGELDYFVVATLQVKELREFQRDHRSPDKPFKPIPTGFKMSKERRKGR